MLSRPVVMCLGTVLTVCATTAFAQVTPTAPQPPDDTPSVRVGATLFTDYSVVTEPKTMDVDGNRITSNSFNITRAYINVTGQLSHIVAFRVTPDVARETGSDSSLNGSYVFRLKYAYAQFNLDHWIGRGAWVRLGSQQTPWVDFLENVYRYRFQGTTLEDREGILSSADLGATLRYQFPGDYGEVHGGIYNGDNYNRAEANDQKALMVRVTVRPVPTHPTLHGLRVTGFYDRDAYVKDAARRRGILGATYEQAYVNAGFHYLATADQTRALSPKLTGHGYSMWATPKPPFGHGWEGLLRFDHLVQEQFATTLDGERDRYIAGAAYWFPRQGSVSSALLFDFERVNNKRWVPSRPNEKRVAVHALINF
jgi:hypothetical protein